MKSIKLFRVVKQSVTFYEDDFNTIEEFDKFVNELKTDEEMMIHIFHENNDTNEVLVILKLRNNKPQFFFRILIV
jgi:hypothetical protein